MKQWIAVIKITDDCKNDVEPNAPLPEAQIRQVVGHEISLPAGITVEVLKLTTKGIGSKITIPSNRRMPTMPRLPKYPRNHPLRGTE